MVDIQRASAGSGKTYTLARKFILYFISIKPEDGPRRLRTSKELEDSLEHILAVTFTNKATNEMQMRIVQKLFALAVPPKDKKPDYLDDFCKELNATPQQVSRTAAKAIKVLLNNYSDFNVSTIDSFFQRVLRTFAYETNLNDSYQVELDSSFLSRMALDAVLDDVDSNEKGNASYWIREIINHDTSNSWNIFQKKEGEKNDTSYKFLIQSTTRLQNEDYKRHRREIEQFFSENADSFRADYTKLRDTFDTPARDSFRELRKEAASFIRNLPEALKPYDGKSNPGKFKSFASKILKGKWDVAIDAFNPDEKFLNSKSVKDFEKINPGVITEIMPAYERLLELHEKWYGIVSTSAFLHWRVYRQSFPFLGLLGEVERMRRDYLSDLNSIELSETSTILSEIIGDDDAPFIYERIGSRLNHFLIDEFQDTSKMQWQLMRPLLDESISRDNDNLIIGDAKQSIYRFRNADPSLISDTVPLHFGSRARLLGNAPAENTNWRSSLRVIQFNNSFFRFLTQSLDEDFHSADPGRFDFRALYSNVVQMPHKKEKAGYVEVSFIKSSKNEIYDSVIPDMVIRTILDLISRKYRMSDIAILVDTNRQGDAAISWMTDYNNRREEGTPSLNFVSEQSLKVASSAAVSIIVSVLEKMARGTDERTADDKDKKHPVDWNRIACNFRFFAMNCPEGTSMADALDRFLESEEAKRKDAGETESDGKDAVSEMLSEMPSLALPAIVEAVTERFVPKALRSRDALYIAAFQDLVMEYCDSHPTDVASFLKWWSRKSKEASVSSPEGIDAIQVMTVHKSKGLEFKAVISPFSNWDMGDKVNEKKKEWRWTCPADELARTAEIEALPPFVPVAVDGKLNGTCHERLLTEYYDMVKMDNLNKAYVDFTRAVHELYVFTAFKNDSKSGKKNREFGAYLKDFVLGGGFADDDMALLDPGCMRISGEDTPPARELFAECEDGEALTVAVGEKPAEAPKEKKPDDEEEKEAEIIGDYKSLPVPGYIKFREESLPRVVEADDFDESDSRDPRSEGSIRHAVLELVRVPDDLHEAVRRAVVAGLMDSGKGREVEAELRRAITSDVAAGWFAPGLRVINERPLLRKGWKMRRPDRIVVRPDGSAFVIDYKFGSVVSDDEEHLKLIKDKRAKYRKQVSGYVSMLRQTGAFREVTGYIWYVRDGIVEDAESEAIK